MKTQWIEWAEPWGLKDEPVFMRVRPEVAIAKMKASFPERNYSDEGALDEFIVVNWAQVIEIEPIEEGNVYKVNLGMLGGPGA